MCVFLGYWVIKYISKVWLVNAISLKNEILVKKYENVLFFSSFFLFQGANESEWIENTFVVIVYWIAVSNRCHAQTLNKTPFDFTRVDNSCFPYNIQINVMKKLQWILCWCDGVYKFFLFYLPLSLSLLRHTTTVTDEKNPNKMHCTKSKKWKEKKRKKWKKNS